MSVDEFGKENAIRVDHMRYDDMNFDSEEWRQKIEEWEGKYCYNGGVVAFVVHGHYYATPLVKEAREVLEKAGFENSYVYCPFNGLDGYPGRLGPKDTEKIWRGVYYPESTNYDPAADVIRYYEQLMTFHSSYKMWNYLLQKAGEPTKDAEVWATIQNITDNREAYNEDAARKIGVYSELNEKKT